MAIGGMKGGLLVSEVSYALESSGVPGKKGKREDSPDQPDSVGGWYLPPHEATNKARGEVNEEFYLRKIVNIV